MKVPMEGLELEYDEEWSFKNFTNGPPISEDLSGKVIYASCFCHEVPDREIFRTDMVGVTFIKCNLDNLIMPPGNKIIADRNPIRFCVQNDAQDWEVDENWEPIRPLNWKSYIKRGEEVPKPESLPEKFIRRETLSRQDYEIKFTNLDQTLYHELPEIIDTKTIGKEEILKIEGEGFLNPWLERARMERK